MKKIASNFIAAISLILAISFLVTSLAFESCRKTTAKLAEERKQPTPTIVELENATRDLSKKICELPPGSILFSDGGLRHVGEYDSVQGIITQIHVGRSFTDSIWFAWNHKDPDYVEFSQFLDTALVVSFKKDQNTYVITGDTTVLFERIDGLIEHIDN